jgi:hypothetical protein
MNHGGQQQPQNTPTEMCIKKNLGELHLINHRKGQTGIMVASSNHRRGKQESWWPAANPEHTNRDVYTENPCPLPTPFYI